MGSQHWVTGCCTVVKMRVFLLLLGILPALNAFCLRNSCSKYWEKAQKDIKITNACAVIFYESCCKDSEPLFVIQRKDQGKLCGLTGFGCKGPNLKDDVESLLVLPGCKLEVWDKGGGLEDAVKAEKKGFNEGDYKDQKDRYERNKLVFTAKRGGQPHWVEEIDDDFDDMNEDIESYRCTCN